MMADHTVKRPQPLLTRAAVVSALSGLVTALVTFGILPAATGHTIEANLDTVYSAVAVLVSVVGPVVHAYVSRRAVTPTAAPQNDAGQALVPAGSAAATLDAAVALAQADKIFPLN